MMTQNLFSRTSEPTHYIGSGETSGQKHNTLFYKILKNSHTTDVSYWEFGCTHHLQIVSIPPSDGTRKPLAQNLKLNSIKQSPKPPPQLSLMCYSLYGSPHSNAYNKPSCKAMKIKSFYPLTKPIIKISHGLPNCPSNELRGMLILFTVWKLCVILHESRWVSHTICPFWKINVWWRSRLGYPIIRIEPYIGQEYHPGANYS